MGLGAGGLLLLLDKISLESPCEREAGAGIMDRVMSHAFFGAGAPAALRTQYPKDPNVTAECFVSVPFLRVTLRNEISFAMGGVIVAIMKRKEAVRRRRAVSLENKSKSTSSV